MKNYAIPFHIGNCKIDLWISDNGTVNIFKLPKQRFVYFGEMKLLEELPDLYKGLEVSGDRIRFHI